VDEELDIAGGAEERGRHRLVGHRFRRFAGRDDPFEGPPPHVGVANDAVRAHVVRPRLELWLHQQHQVGAFHRQLGKGGEDQAKGDERQVGHHHLWDEREIGRNEVAHVRALEERDPGVPAKLPRQLTVPHVDGHDPGRPSLEQAVREATGGRTRVEGIAAGDPHPESLQCRVEFVTTSGNVPAGRPGQTEGLVLSNER
jgi:hypothetical protein